MKGKLMKKLNLYRFVFWGDLKSAVWSKLHYKKFINMVELLPPNFLKSWSSTKKFMKIIWWIKFSKRKLKLKKLSGKDSNWKTWVSSMKNNISMQSNTVKEGKCNFLRCLLLDLRKCQKTQKYKFKKLN